ncbi:MAG TPA: CocE/NonD family hydrolase [Nocardioidaceae bacterium]|nr:CocE/NonD family hydrolase [Nocardioidaceae bacterium]
MSRRVAFLLSVASIAAALPMALSGLPAAAADPFTVETLHFQVLVGPDDNQPCDIVGDLYTPTGLTRPAPAILTTNGFGGSKDGQAPLARLAASNGYVVLSYSGLGFGGSTCKITLDDPDYDGKAGKQLIDYLASLPFVAKEKGNDPKVGMVGGSYGGAIQFAVASVDPRLDTIIPMITWNDLSYSIGPNNTDQLSPGAVSSGTPGAIKLLWGAGFSARGVLDGAQQAQDDPARMLPCPNFADFVCPALVTAGTTGFFQPDAVAALRHASVASYVDKVRIPTLLMQGQNDTLFNLNESVATYHALKAQGTPVKMVWHSWGHSGGPQPGEIDLGAPDPATQYQTGRILAWFDHYLKGRNNVGTGPAFAYFRDWVDYTGNAAPAFGTSSSFPVGTAKTYTFSGTGQLTQGVPAVGSQTFTTVAAGAPTSINPFDVLGGYAPLPAVPATDLPGTFAAWTTPALTSKVDVVGSPVATFRVSAPTVTLSQLAGPAGQLVLFVKVQDVAPDGTASLIYNLEAPIRVPDATKPIKVTLPAIVHRFEQRHQIRLVVAGGSTNYRSGVTATPVTIASGLGQTLSLPVVP